MVIVYLLPIVRVCAVGQVLGFIQIFVPVRSVAGVATTAAVAVPNVVGHMLNVDRVVRLVVMSVRHDLISGLGRVVLQAPGDEEDDGEDEGDLGGSESLERDQLDDEEFPEQDLGSEETDDATHTAVLLLTTA